MTDTHRELLAFVIGHRIRSLRQRRRLSQADLAHGISSQSLISLCESGRQLPLPDMLQLIAERLEDKTLAEYASALATGDLSFSRTITGNRELLLEALTSLRGHWQNVHEQVATELCQHYYTTKDFDIVHQIGRMILDHAQDPRTQAAACFYSGSSFLFTHDYEEAERWLVMAEQHLADADSPLRPKLLYNLGYTYTQLDNPVMALWYAHQAAECFQAQQDLPSYAKAVGLLGVIQVRAKRPEDGVKSLRLAYDVLIRWESERADRARIACSLAAACLEQGQLEEAKTWAEEALAGAEAADDDLCACLTLRNLALWCHRQGDFAQGLRFLHRALAIARAHRLHKTTAELLLLRAETECDGAKKLADARQAFEAALNAHDHVLIALSAEAVANLLEGTGGSPATDAAYEVQQYRKLALAHYRAYVRAVSYDYPGIDRVAPAQPNSPSPFDRSGQ
ncbi:helix-turn-helix domain-containing protein [Alicyclobacillus kakegawensis]|uniref:helix-turn-helix domain-containing protein n=1 Tax=Alicyclobacillus kakegawensis TaxID=392012 RepID=UPI00082BB568|nr:helix-turn-helix domain-containing protein [Alicyclobacillus kakegawensis]